MQTFPNILPVADADLVRGGTITASEGAPGKIKEPFAHLMTRALLPSSKETNPAQNLPAKTMVSDSEKENVPLNKSSQPFQVQNKVAENSNHSETDIGYFLFQPKNPQSDAQTSDKNPHKKADNSNVVASSSERPKITGVAINLENVSVPAPALVEPMMVHKSESSAKITPNIPVANSKTPSASKSAGITGALPKEKNVSPTAPKIFGQIVSQNQAASIQTNPMDKAVGQEKITAAVETLTAEKTNLTDSKVAGLTPTNLQVPPLTEKVTGDLPAPKPVVESFVQSPPHELSTSPHLTLKTAVQAKPDVSGTSVARQDMPMKKTEKTDKTTGSAGKILPGAAVSVARVNNLPMRENFSALALSRAGQISATGVTDAPGRMTNVAPMSADSLNSVAGAATVDFRSRTLERAQDMIVLNATRLNDLSVNSLQVVIKPGAGTQLSLELRQHGDGIEAQAVLQSGDFEHLNQQWPGLQQQLEQRGIRLAPLVNDGNFSNSSGNNNTFQHKQNQSAESDSFPAGMFAEVAPAGSFAQAAARAGAHRGWETWA
jgi:hypothetical protein